MAAVFDPFEIRSDPGYEIFPEDSSTPVDPPGGAEGRRPKDTPSRPGGADGRQPKDTPSRPLIIISGPNSPPSEYDDDGRFDSNTDDFDIGVEMIHSSAGILESNSMVIESLASRLDKDVSFDPSKHHGDLKKHHPHHHHHVGVLKHPGYDALDENQLPESKALDLSQVFNSFLHKKKPKSGRLPKKMKKVLGRFRSGSVDGEKSSKFSIGLEETTGARARSYSSTDTDAKSSTCSPRPPPNDKVWVIASPFSPPPPGNQGLALGSRPPPGFLSELSLHSTPVDAGGPPAGHPHTRASYPGTSQLSANDLHDSVLSALSHGAGPEGFDDVSPKKSSLERKVSSKRKPSGTFEYKVKDGDTLVKIAAHFDVTPSELININKILSRTVFVGQTLFIPDPAYVPSDPPTPRSASPAPDTRPKVFIH